MKTKLIFAVALFLSLNSFSQTNGWYLYTKASTINKIVPDDTNANEIHLATDIGYIKYNTTTNMVTGFLNLTSQSPAIGLVNGLDVNPTNANIALALDDGIAIYDGATVTIYNYDNSALTVGSVGGSQFTKLEVRYGRLGELYIFKPDVTGYQVFNAGVFDTEKATAFMPRDIIENQAGTVVFFAGNDGLHELVKATTTWTNYTTSNSVLITNPLLSLQVDASDILYIGGFQGLNTLDSSGVWNTYQQSAPPPNAAFFLPVYDISVDNTTGGLLIRTSKPNTSYFGLSTLTLATNTWTNYTSDNTNCLNANVFRASAFGGDGKIYSAPQNNSDPGRFIEFAPGTNTCTPLDINYLNAPIAVNSGLISSFTVRKKANGNLDIGFTRGENLHILEINPDTFNGTLGAATTIIPSIGKSAYSLLSDNDYFIVETNTGWVFVDDTNNTTESNHNLPNNLALGTKKAAAFDSSNGILNLIFKSWDAAFNFRVYKTQCNIATATCSVPEEIFTTNRDFTQNIVFGVNQNDTTDEVTAVAVHVGASSGRIGNLNNVKQRMSSNDILLNELKYEASTNGIALEINQDVISMLFPSRDPTIYHRQGDTLVVSIVKSDSKTVLIRTISHTTGENIGNEFSFDKDGDGVPDEILGSYIFDAYAYRIATFIIKNSDGVSLHRYFVLVSDNGENVSLITVPVDSAKFITTQPGFLVTNSELIRESPQGSSRSQNQNEATMVMLTNYGVLIKTGIDISSLLLSTDDASLKETNLLLYPNPANDMVSFSDNSIKTIAVYDINGKRVLKKQGDSFSVKTLAQGIYIVKAARADNIIVTKKLIVD